jgi:hypothetical protein
VNKGKDGETDHREHSKINLRKNVHFEMPFYLFIAILLVKIARVRKPNWFGRPKNTQIRRKSCIPWSKFLTHKIVEFFATFLDLYANICTVYVTRFQKNLITLLKSFNEHH